jgi:hypothetical protein
VIGRRLDILATNRMARALLADFDTRPVRDRNHARWIFIDPATRDLYVDWPVVARENVAILRRDAGRYPHDTELPLIGELSVASPEFRTGRRAPCSCWRRQAEDDLDLDAARARRDVLGRP